MSDKKPDRIEVICQNRKANHDYHVMERYEAGIVLIGQEVKSLRNYACSLVGSFVTVNDGEVWMNGCDITLYTFTHHVIYEPKRKRKLHLNKKEIVDLQSSSSERGFTIIPMKIYFKNGRAKVEIAICKGKQAHDKRESNKERDAEREIRKYS